MNNYKRLTCPCTLSFYREHQKAQDSAKPQDASSEQGMYRDLLGMSAQLDIREKTYQETNFPLELIVVPCSKHQEWSIEYLTVTLDLKATIFDLEAKCFSLPPDAYSERNVLFSILARLRHLRFVCLTEPSDLAAAIACLRSGVRFSDSDKFHKSLLWTETGMYLHSQYHLVGESSFLEEAIKRFEEAIELARLCTVSATSPFLLRELGSLIFCLYQSTGDSRHLDRAINYLRECIDSASIDRRTLVSCSRLLMDILMTKFHKKPRLEDLDDVIRQHERIAGLLDNAPQATERDTVFGGEVTTVGYQWRTTHSALLYTRFLHPPHEVSDLRRAIQMVEPLAEYIPRDCPSSARAALITCLVNCLIELFKVEGRVEDLNRVAQLVSYKPYHSTTYNQAELEHVYQTGKLLITAFEWFGRRQDIDAAVRDLGLSLFQAHMMQWASRDVQSAHKFHLDLADIMWVRRAIIVQPDPDSLLRMINTVKQDHRLHIPSGLLLDNRLEEGQRFYDLGRAHAMRFEHSAFRDETDIDEAISLFQSAQELVDEMSDIRWQYDLALGNSYRIRFIYSPQPHDLTEAVRLHRHALDRFPMYNVYRIRALGCLGQSLFHQAMTNNDPQSYHESMRCLREAVQAQYGFTNDRLNAAIIWASLLHSPHAVHFVREDARLEQALSGYKHAVELLGKAAWLGISARSRLARLYSVPRTLASDAAACAIRLAELNSGDKRDHYLGIALQLLDQGRAILWSQASQLRADLKKLSLQDPTLAKRLDGLAKAIEKTMFREMGEHDEDAGHTTEDLVLRWEMLLKQVRQRDDFRDFLLPLSIEKLKQAAASATIVVVNISDHRCDAVVILQDGCLQLVPLPRLSRREVDYAVKDLQDALRDDYTQQELGKILVTLWRNVCRPVLNRLRELTIIGKTPSASDGPPPRIRWCPTGNLAMLPLHAAGPRYQSPAKPGMLDWVVSSYIPTLSMLLNAEAEARRATPPPPQILAVCHAGGKERGEIPHVEEEVKALEATAGVEKVTLLKGDEARVDSICDALQGEHWVHFACHGTQNRTNPMESALILTDGKLPVSRLAEQHSGGEFAMLLACETAMGIRGLSDEAIHVAAGLHFAGFRSVIATMWTMCDEDGPLVAEKVYGHLFRKKPGNALPNASEAAYALREALLFLRDVKKRDVQDWAPFVHFGV